MKLQVIAQNCEVLKKAHRNENGVEWDEVAIAQGMNLNTITVDKTTAPLLKERQLYDLEIQVNEQPKSGYVANKFRIVGIKKNGTDLAK